MPTPFDVIFFDFAGVLAEEGFVAGLKHIGSTNGHEPDDFLTRVADICYNDGYASGKSDEATFWQTVRDEFGLTDSDDELRHEILSRFVVRLWMLDVVDNTKKVAPLVAMLSDQTNWLDELDAAHDLYSHFDVVFNSYQEGMTKREPEFFDYACEKVGVQPERALFIDDNPKNIARAQSRGLKTILFESYEQFVQDMQEHYPDLEFPV